MAVGHSRGNPVFDNLLCEEITRGGDLASSLSPIARLWDRASVLRVACASVQVVTGASAAAG